MKVSNNRQGYQKWDWSLICRQVVDILVQFRTAAVLDTHCRSWEQVIVILVRRDILSTNPGRHSYVTLEPTVPALHPDTITLCSVGSGGAPQLGPDDKRILETS